MQSEKEVASLSVTFSGCPMFQEIVNKLQALHKALASPLFERSWKNLSKRLDQVRIVPIVFWIFCVQII